MAEYVATTQESVPALVRRLERDYISGYTLSSKYVRTSLSDDVNKVYAYLESKHVSGDTDSLGREKPFFNIVLAARNIWFRATDLDRKDIKVKATKNSDILTAFIGTAWIQDWMRKENFGAFLNDWGINMAGFNETVVKFVPQKGRLIPSVVPWNRLICDPVNFKDNPKIEVLEFTEAQLYKQGYNKDQVQALCNARKARETLERQRKDNKATYVKLYEVHGEFSQAVYKQAKNIPVTDGDDDVYFQQMHVISFVEGQKEGEYSDFTLYSGKEKDPYILTALFPEVDGSIALRGAVKTLFEAQWMVNHNVKAIKDQLDLASKLIFQTSDATFLGQNAISAIENGDILIHAANQPLTQLQNNSHDVASLESVKDMWKSLANEIAGISESMLGINAPSGTPLGQTTAILAESHSLFEIMTENKGLYVEEMLRNFIIPFLKTKFGTSKQITATLDAHGIAQIDAMYVKSEATKKMMSENIASALAGKAPTQTMEGATQQIQGQMSVNGGQRFFVPSALSDKTWKDIFTDFEWEIECDITGEDGPDKDDLVTLTNVLQIIGNNPRVLYDPNAKMLFNKILSGAGGVSPLELMTSQPFITPPQKRFTETLDYKDAPDDIKRQMEAQQGFTPSQMPSSNSVPAQPSQPPAPPTLPASALAGIKRLITKR